MKPKKFRYKEEIQAMQWDGTKGSLIDIYDCFGFNVVIGNHETGEAILTTLLGKIHIKTGDYVVFMGGSLPDVMTAEEFEREYEPVEE